MFLQIGVFPTTAHEFGPAAGFRLTHKVAKVIVAEFINRHSLNIEEFTDFLGCGLENGFNVGGLANLFNYAREGSLLLNGFGDLLSTSVQFF